jgi:hypothetical protein
MACGQGTWQGRPWHVGKFEHPRRGCEPQIHLFRMVLQSSSSSSCHLILILFIYLFIIKDLQRKRKKEKRWQVPAGEAL